MARAVSNYRGRSWSARGPSSAPARSARPQLRGRSRRSDAWPRSAVAPLRIRSRPASSTATWRSISTRTPSVTWPARPAGDAIARPLLRIAGSRAWLPGLMSCGTIGHARRLCPGLHLRPLTPTLVGRPAPRRGWCDAPEVLGVWSRMRIQPGQPGGASLTGARPQPAHLAVWVAAVQHAVAAVTGDVGHWGHRHAHQSTDGGIDRRLDVDTTASRNASTSVRSKSSTAATLRVVDNIVA
jgi:hypothetical protein